MGRLAPEGVLRFSQAMPGSLNVTFAGAEANVAASLAMLGEHSVAFVTALPKHAIADACVNSLRALGVDTRHVLRRDIGRLGLYFLETGANQRPSQVIYDREGSTISQTAADAYAWKSIFAGADWFHVTGITPAVSEQAAEAALRAVREARTAGLTISCDLNFRKKLWNWDTQLKPRELAERTMRGILDFVDILIANEEDCGDVLKIHAQGTDVHAGHLSVDHYPDVARQVAEQFPRIKYVAITLRESISATHNNWGGMLYEVATDTAHFAPVADGSYRPYEIRNIIDRVGGGDAFGAGLIHALGSDDWRAPECAIQFAVAASCLAHSIVGDFNYASIAEITALAGGAASGRVVR